LEICLHDVAAVSVSSALTKRLLLASSMRYTFQGPNETHGVLDPRVEVVEAEEEEEGENDPCSKQHAEPPAVVAPKSFMTSKAAVKAPAGLRMKLSMALVA
jgi:hypothetical protein